MECLGRVRLVSRHRCALRGVSAFLVRVASLLLSGYLSVVVPLVVWLGAAPCAARVCAVVGARSVGF